MDPYLYIGYTFKYMHMKSAFALDFTVGYQVVTQHQNKVNKSISCIVKKKCIECALVV